VAATRSRARRRLSSGFNLGGQQAEADPLLEQAFYRTSQYRAVADRDDPHCFLIGRTGSGKSAILRQLETEHRGHIVRITPEDLALTYVADLQAVRWLDQQGVHLDPLFIALWKHVFLIELIKHRYKVYSPDAKQNFISSLSERIRKDRSKLEALRYLEEFQGKFWCEADERVREIADRFESQIRTEAGVKLGGSFSAAADEKQTGEQRREMVARFQRVVNETQLPRLNQMIKVLDEDILNSPQNFVTIVIDDLDQDWVDDRVTNTLIRCLFRAVLDLKRVRNLKILVALRTNIFEALDFGQRTGGQEEKFRSLSMRMRWSAADMTAMLDERARAAGERLDTEILGVRSLLPTKNKTRGDALEFIYRRTLMRPRDAINYLNECLSGATANPRITWERIHAAEDAYSKSRLLALRDEWKPTYPGIDRVLAVFEDCEAVMDPSELGRRLDELALIAVDPDFEGASWLSQLTGELWKSGESEWADCYGGLARFLFNIGFLGSALAKTKPVYVQDEPGYLDRRNRIAACERFLIHPAFRRSLDCRFPDDQRRDSDPD
jgi:hypothetical protein